MYCNCIYIYIHIDILTQDTSYVLHDADKLFVFREEEMGSTSTTLIGDFHATSRQSTVNRVPRRCGPTAAVTAEVVVTGVTQIHTVLHHGYC